MIMIAAYAIMSSMTKVSDGAFHKLPADLKTAIEADKTMFVAWEDITPLARNEFICWVTDAKKPETRARRIVIARDKLHKGERRPCCWIGCIHRTDKAISPSVKGILEKRGKNNR